MAWIKWVFYLLYTCLVENLQIGCLSATIYGRNKREVTTLPASGCPANWLEFDSLCYFFDSNTVYTWENANTTCVELGGHLASIHSTQENEFIYSHITYDTWIGLFQQYQGAPFKWSDGTDTDFLQWSRGEPNDDTWPELCTEIYGSTADAEQRRNWNDNRCITLNRLVCRNIHNNCDLANCQNGGSCVHTLGSYICSCRYGFYGQHCEHVVSSFPSVVNIWPSSGPVAGGTALTVVATNLPGPGIRVVLQIGIIRCKTTYQDSNLLIGTTPHLFDNQNHFLDEELQVTVRFEDGTVLESGHIFVYKSDPVIHGVHPKKTIIKGGTHLTVTGERFRSISGPTMITFVKHSQVINKTPLVYHSSIDSYENACKVHSDTQMLCKTAQINLPEDFQPIAKNEMKRDLHTESTIQGSLYHRVKREVIERSVNGDTLKFYIGFKLDDVDNFKNYSFIEVYTEPAFHLRVGVIDYIGGMSINFTGENLDVGITVDDYMMTIGTGTCSSITLLTNSLSCFPPDSPPQLKRTNHGAYPEIIIHVGTNIEYLAGYMRYTHPTTQTPSTETLSTQTPSTPTETSSWKLYTIITSTIAAAAVAVCVVVVTIVCIKHKHRNIPKDTTGEINNGQDLGDRNYERLNLGSQI